MKSNIHWLFPENGDVDPAGFFFRNLLWTMEAMGKTTKVAANKFARLLMQYTRQNDLCNVKACAARAWLVQIWKDVPSTRPHHDLLMSCAVRWLADPYEMRGQRFKPIPYMHRSQSQNIWSLKMTLKLSFGFLNFICLLAMSNLFGGFLVLFWGPLGTLKE